MRFESSLVEVLPKFVGSGKGSRRFLMEVVTIEQILLVRQVAELVGGGHLELIVLQRCQHHSAVL